MESQHLRNIVEAALLAAGGPLTLDQLKALFGDNDGPERQEIRDVLTRLQEDYSDRGIQIVEVASGYRIQVRDNMAQWLTRLWEDRPPRYSRALMETLAIVAYRQPVTRGDIEEIRGVAVTTHIIRTLLERDWIKVVGHRDVPGKPAMFGTTRQFLDYFGLKKLDDLPPLAELAQLEPVSVQLELGTADQLPAEFTGSGPDNVVPVDGVEDQAAEPRAERYPDDDADGNRDDSDDDNDVDGNFDDDYDDDDADGNFDDSDDDEDEHNQSKAVSAATDEVATAPMSAKIASLDRARAAAVREPETDFNAERAEVVPLKKS